TNFNKSMNKSDYYTQKLNLLPHPEGGYYRETYRSATRCEFKGFDGERSLATSIYFLLTAERSSAMHRIKSDEIWYFHDGDALDIMMIDIEGNHSTVRLGKNLDDNEVLQFVVPAGFWFGAKTTGDYSLVGCEVSPGFDFRDFELM
ncbi:MAG: cupin domain-containing protein, partial [Flavobacteriales bacterium]